MSYKLIGAVAVMLLPFSISAQITIALFDTAFCVDKLYSPTNVHIEKTLFSDGRYPTKCSELTKNNRLYHGHYVLKEFLKSLRSDEQIRIVPITIYDAHHRQTYKTWSNALALAKSKKATILLSANGLSDDKKYSLELLRINFLASGQVGGKVKRSSSLFPQSLKENKRKDIILVGSYYPTTPNERELIKDPSMLYQNEIDYYTLPEVLQGSSGAVAKTLALSVNHCFTPLKKGDGEKVKACLLKLQ